MRATVSTSELSERAALVTRETTVQFVDAMARCFLVDDPMNSFPLRRGAPNRFSLFEQLLVVPLLQYAALR